MYQIVRAEAITPPATLMGYSGFILTKKEITRLFHQEGFTKDKTISNYIDIWIDTKLIHAIRPGIYAFEPRTKTEIHSVEECSINEDTTPITSFGVFA